MVIKKTGKLVVGSDVITTEPILVKFKNHQFDTEDQGWDATTREYVEKEMQNKRRFEWFNMTSDPRGYWAAKTSRRDGPRPQEQRHQCEAMVETAPGDVRTCPNITDDDVKFCDDHIHEAVGV